MIEDTIYVLEYFSIHYSELPGYAFYIYTDCAQSTGVALLGKYNGLDGEWTPLSSSSLLGRIEYLYA